MESQFFALVPILSLLVFFLQENALPLPIQKDYKSKDIFFLFRFLLAILSPLVLSYLLINKITQKPFFILLYSLCIAILNFEYFNLTNINFPFINISVLCILSTLYLVISNSFLQVKTVNGEPVEGFLIFFNDLKNTLSKKIKNIKKNSETIKKPLSDIEPKQTELINRNGNQNFKVKEDFSEKHIDELLNENTILINKPAEIFKTEENITVSNLEKNISEKFNKIDNDLINHIGKLGEEFILKYEINKLQKIGKAHLVSKIKHIPIIYGNVNDYGRDITSFNELEEEIKIEVKTTVSGKNTMFYITENEYKYIKNSNNYFIYRVYDFDIEKKEGVIIIINAKNELNKFFKITEAKYVAKPRR